MRRSRKRNPDDDFEDSGPDLEESYVISDERRGGYSIGLSGRYLGARDTWKDTLKFIVEHSIKSGYYPNVYYVNDHGNVDLLEIKKKGRGYDSKIIQSWV